MNPTTKPPTPPTTPGSGWVDPNFAKNQNKIPLAELSPWAGQHVAWSWDGTQVIAGAGTLDALYKELHRRGIDTATVVFGYVDLPGETHI